MKRKRQSIPTKLTSVSDEIVVDLPEDIITEILTCLPVKTLLKFRSVCKSWLCLISNPKFIETHLIRSSNATHQKLILNVFSKTLDNLYSCVLGDKNIDSFVPLVYPLKAPHDHYGVSILGSCNGLVCVCISQVGIFIWNPSTRKSKNLFRDAEFQYYSLLAFGFGYDQLNDDYKVLTTGYQNRGEVRMTKIYSLKNNSWGKIQSFPRIIYRNGGGKYVNGVLHWVKTNSDIVSFDFGNETFGELSSPRYSEGIIVSDFVLGVFDGCLSASCCTNKTCSDIWVMKEYGVHDSWVKLLTISHSTYMHWSDVYLPIHIFKTGQFLLKSEVSFIAFNSNSQRSGFVTNLFSLGRGFEATTYVESLISPNLDGGEGQTYITSSR